MKWLPLSNAGPAVPLTNNNVASGSIVLTDNEPELIVDRINAPFLGFVEDTIEIIGHSMEPTFGNGCRITWRKSATHKLAAYQRLVSFLFPK